MNRDMPGAASNANAAFNELQRFNNARNSMRTLKNLADFMAGMRGRRKAVVFFSEGINYDVTDPFDNPLRHRRPARDPRPGRGGDARQRQRLQRRSARRDVSGMEDAIEIGGFPGGQLIKPSDLMNEMRLEHDSLRVVADETGGFAVLNQNDFRTGVLAHPRGQQQLLRARLLSDQRQAGRPLPQRPGQGPEARPEGARPPRLRRAGPGEEGDARPKGSPGAKATPALREALDSPIPISGLTISAFAAPFKGAGNNVAIAMAIEVDGSAMKFTHDARRARSPTTSRSRSTRPTSNGKIKDGVRDVIGLALRPQTYEIVRRRRVPRSSAASRCRPANTSSASARASRAAARSARHLRPRRARFLEGHAGDERHRDRVGVGQPPCRPPAPIRASTSSRTCCPRRRARRASFRAGHARGLRRGLRQRREDAASRRDHRGRARRRRQGRA